MVVDWRCSRCGGNLILDQDGWKCLQCAREYVERDGALALLVEHEPETARERKGKGRWTRTGYHHGQGQGLESSVHCDMNVTEDE